MIIAGLQKLTLLDFPEKVASIVFTAGCNFRCPFCHNGSLVLENDPIQTIEEAEVMEFLAKRKGILEGVVVTGGEPLLHSDLSDFLKKVKDLGYLVKLDTNGTNPHHLADLMAKQLLDYVAMDIKNAPATYGKAVGCPHFSLSAIEQTKALLWESGIPHEFRTTLVRGIHREADVLAMAEWLKGAEAYYLQSYVPSERVLSPEGLSPFSGEEMEQFLLTVQKFVPNAKLRGV